MDVKSTITLPTLARWQDYNEWYDTLKLIAEELEVWKYINPDTNDLPPRAPTMPTPQDYFGKDRNQLSNDERQELKEYREDYTFLKPQSRRTRSTIVAIKSAIRASLSTEFSSYLEGKDSTRAQLTAFRQHFKLTEELRFLELEHEYEDLRKAPFKVKVDMYLNRWQLFSKRNALTSFISSEQIAARHLRKAIGVHFPIRAAVRADRLTGTQVRIQDEISYWSQTCQEEGLNTFPSLTAKQRIATVPSL